MTEKRFVHIEHKGADYILDNPNWDLDYLEMLGDTLEAKEIVELLNMLHEDNERLKKENMELEKFRYAVFKNLHTITEKGLQE